MDVLERVDYHSSHDISPRLFRQGRDGQRQEARWASKACIERFRDSQGDVGSFPVQKYTCVMVQAYSVQTEGHL